MAMMFADFGALPRYHNEYHPSPVKKGANILKLQQKLASHDGEEPVTRNYHSYHEADQPTFEIVASPVKISTTGCSSNYRCLDSPKSVMFLEDDTSPVKKSNPVDASPIKKSNLRNLDSPKSVIPRPPVSRVRFAEEEELLSDDESLQSPPPSPKNRKKSAVKPRPMKSVTFATRTYPSWDFGKTKHFERPRNTSKNNQAATTIQRIARGGIQRLHYKIARCEWLLQTREERTKADVAKIAKELAQSKKSFRAQMEEEAKKEERLLQQTSKTVEESHKLIAYLRQENKKLREKNKKIHDGIVDLKRENSKLEDAKLVADTSLKTLQEHFKIVEETHAKLMDVIPQYEASIKTVEEAIETRQQFGAAEHKIRLLFVKLLGDIVETLEESETEQAMAEEVMDSILELEKQELAQGRPLIPEKLTRQPSIR